MRYWEIDVLRGIGVLLMISYHFVFDLFYPSHSQFLWLAVLTASVFILVSGISLSISYSRGGDFKKFAKRGLKLLLLACIVTFASFLFLDQGFILFGILHFFAITSFLIYLFLKYSKRRITFFLGVVVILIGLMFLTASVDVGYLVWLGLTPLGFSTFDFFPIFPWFGLLLIGVYIGSHIYPDGKRSFTIRDINNAPSKILQFFGKNSLMIYFIHQPIILLILYILNVGDITYVLNIGL